MDNNKDNTTENMNENTTNNANTEIKEKNVSKPNTKKSNKFISARSLKYGSASLITIIAVSGNSSNNKYDFKSCCHQ